MERTSRQTAESLQQSFVRTSCPEQAPALPPAVFLLGENILESSEFLRESLMLNNVKMCKPQEINLSLVIFSSMKESLSNTRDAIDGRENMANILETHFSTLEKTLLNTQFRLSKLIQQWQWQATVMSFSPLISSVFIYEWIVQGGKCMHAHSGLYMTVL